MATKNKEKLGEDETRDIYEGKELNVWEDDTFVHMTFGLTSMAFPKEDKIWNELKNDLKKFVKKI